MYPRHLVNFELDRVEKHFVDYLVVGSGLAGLYVALNLAPHGRVLVISKTTVLGGSSLYAQGGIAAALGETDSPACHFDDTIKAGAGLCHEEAVRILVREGPDHVKKLIEMGAPFDSKDGRPTFTIEGAHSRPRVLHAGGDATGREICRTLARHVVDTPGLEITENVMVVDLIEERRRCIGVLVMGENGILRAYFAGGIVLATGGIGQIYMTTTNPPEGTGDGIAMALRAGVELKDMEFIQFHPTALDHLEARGFLVSEAVRGEGAVLRNEDGLRFMQEYHPGAELAPRDVVARGIYRQVFGARKKVFLDATHFPGGFFRERFPSIHQTLESVGLDPSKDWIPVSPAAHYLMGGIKTDTQGRTSMKSLYACGETACTGVDGANRLASNSLLECLVFGARAAAAAVEDHLPPGRVSGIISQGDSEVELNSETLRVQDNKLRALMEEHVGIVRNECGLKTAIAEIEEMFAPGPLRAANRDCLELQNKLHTAHAVARGALAREKSCGAHYRSDEPGAEPRKGESF